MFDSMCRSKQYQTLSIGAKLFYMICRVQAMSTHGRSCLYKHGEEYGIVYNAGRDFVFPSAHLAKYGIDRRNADKYFKQLEKAGFIEKKECNKVRKKVNVYSFSANWWLKAGDQAKEEQKQDSPNK